MHTYSIFQIKLYASWGKESGHWFVSITLPWTEQMLNKYLINRHTKCYKLEVIFLGQQLVLHIVIDSIK